MQLLFAAHREKPGTSKANFQRKENLAKAEHIAAQSLTEYILEPGKSVPISAIASFLKQQVVKAGLSKALITRQKVVKLLNDQPNLYKIEQPGPEWKIQHGSRYIKLEPTKFKSKQQLSESRQSLNTDNKNTAASRVRQWLKQFQPEGESFIIREITPQIRKDLAQSGFIKPVTPQTVHKAVLQLPDKFERMPDAPGGRLVFRRKPKK